MSTCCYYPTHLLLIVAFLAATSSQAQLLAQLSPTQAASVAIQTAGQAPIEAHEDRARFKFIAMQHGYTNDSQAMEALSHALRLTTGHQVQVDTFDYASSGEPGHFDVTWYSQQLVGCAERPALELLARIQHPMSDTFTREFKMYLGEDFSYPKRVEIQWLGSCENLGRKRSQVSQGAESSTQSADGVEVSSSSTELSNTSTTTPATTSEPSMPPTSTTQPELEVPSEFTPTTTQPTSASQTDDDNLFSSQQSSTTTTESSFFSSSLFGNDDFGASGFSLINENMTDTSTTTTTSTSTSTTTAAETIETTTSNATTSNATTTTPVPTTTASDVTTTTGEPTSTSTVASEEPLISDKLQELNLTEVVEEATSADTTAASPDEGATVAPSLEQSANLTVSPVSSTANAHYGKYVGLTTAFLTFIAYLVCARAYRRQGMYELHDERIIN